MQILEPDCLINICRCSLNKILYLLNNLLFNNNRSSIIHFYDAPLSQHIDIKYGQ